jgi:hypothetical protein
MQPAAHAASATAIVHPAPIPANLATIVSLAARVLEILVVAAKVSGPQEMPPDRPV